ncbi:tyrosine kinase receptor Cad96Ca, partial [Anoplophora glabripennis]|uniref:tyrosine kinase receptor Cad96Ca n=1 Tax=Anoplophora glabripennis TaxID=217634 RepID=UPI000C78A271
AGQNLHLYVTAFDGQLLAKTEVNVNILNESLRYNPSKSNRPPFSLGQNANIFKYPGVLPPKPPPLPPSLPDYTNNPPPEISNNPYIQRQHIFQQKTYPEQNTRKPERKSDKNVATILKPVEIEKEVDNNLSEKTESITNTQKPTTARPVNKDIESTNELLAVDQSVKSLPELTATVIPIASVFAVFLTVGVIAMVFRKKIYLGKPKDSKEDMRKESSGGIVLRESPGLNLQEWRGVRAFSNRYEPWQNDSNHTQLDNQESIEIKNIDQWEFPRHRLKFFNILGEGAFGQVWKCEAVDLDGKDSGVSVVAVKTLKENANEKERSDLISELQVMKMLDPHPNVVRLLGCCSDKEPIFLIMEYITKGKLQSYLRNSRAERYYNNMHGHSKSLTSQDLTSFVHQVAKGMEFLSKNGIIHRDLAARNILITEDHTCKVADFGFARDVIASHIYERKSEGRLPIRWMAPESLYDNIFSVKSDVWSFGVLIWEVVTLGSTPYPGMSAADVMKKVRDGYRLDKPEHCRRELYNIMYYCWDKDPKQRPSFTECVELLEKLLMTETDYIELERFPDHSYYNMMSLSGEKL